MHREIASLNKYFHVPEQRVSPPDPDPDPQVTREDYEYHTPQARADVADDLIIALEECAHSIDFLNQSEPLAGECFPGAKMVLAALINKVREYRKEKVEPWL